MRIASRTLTRNYLTQVNKAYNDYAQATARIASGNKFTSASEDVQGSAQILKTRTNLYKTEKQLDNVKRYNDEVKSTEDAMSNVNTILTKIHSSLLKKAENEPTGGEGREAIATEIDNLLDEVVSLANQQYNGKFVFGGTNAAEAPFAIGDDGKVTYNGIPVDEIKKDDATGEYYYVNDDGKQVEIPRDKKMYIDTGNGLVMDENHVDSTTAVCVTYSGLDIFGVGTTSGDSGDMSNNIIQVLKELSDAVREGDTDKMTAYDKHLDTLADTFKKNLTDIGGKEVQLQNAQTRLEDLRDTYKLRINNVMGINDAEEATNQSQASTVLKAVFAVGANLLPMSLMDYVK